MEQLNANTYYRPEIANYFLSKLHQQVQAELHHINEEIGLFVSNFTDGKKEDEHINISEIYNNNNGMATASIETKVKKLNK
jgi:hypothetical protein